MTTPRFMGIQGGVRQPGRPPGLAWWRHGELQHPVRTQPAQQLNRQVGEQERQAGHVVSGVEDQQDVRVAVLDVPGPRIRPMTSRTCVAVTLVSSSSGVMRTASSTAVNEVRPGSNAAMTEYGQSGIIGA